MLIAISTAEAIDIAAAIDTREKGYRAPDRGIIENDCLSLINICKTVDLFCEKC